jgi:anti-sigma B factor antagonist
VHDHPGGGPDRDFTLRPEVRDTSLDIALAGELDMNAAFRLEPQLEELLETPGIRTVALDLADVDFVDSAGLGALLSLREQAKRLGIELTVVRMSPPVQSLLDTTATRSLFGV